MSPRKALLPAITATLTGGVLAVGLLAAPAANAATLHAVHVTKILAESITVGKHKDRVLLTPVGKTTAHYTAGNGDTVTVYKTYRLEVKDGKQTLIKYTEGYRRALLTVVGLIVREDRGAYKRDSQVVADVRTVHQASNAKIDKAWNSLFAAARKAALQSDVRNTVDNVATYFATTENPTQAQVDANVDIVKSGKDQVVVTVTGTGGYTVVGTDTQDNYTYSFDSSTGVFKAGTIK